DSAELNEAAAAEQRDRYDADANGPFKVFGFKVLPPQIERMFEESFDAAAQRSRLSFEQAGRGGLKLSNRDLDTGRMVSPGEYALTDRPYEKLLVKLGEKKFDGVAPCIRENILGFYDSMPTPHQHDIGAQLDALRAHVPVVRVPSGFSGVEEMP